MNFQLRKEQRDIRQAAWAFAEGEIRDIAREYVQREEFPMGPWKKACDLGLVGVYIDEAYGGRGPGCPWSCHCPCEKEGHEKMVYIC